MKYKKACKMSIVDFDDAYAVIINNNDIIKMNHLEEFWEIMRAQAELNIYGSFSVKFNGHECKRQE